MQSAHCINLAKLESVFEVSIEKAKYARKKLEYEFAKWTEFRTATLRVEDLPENSFDSIDFLIDRISCDIESKSDYIEILKDDLKENVVEYFKKHLNNVELCQELKDIAAMYNFVPNGRLALSNEDRSAEHVTGLLEIQGWFEEDYQKFQQFSQELAAQKQQLLDYREEMIAADSPSLSEHIAHVEQDIFNVSESFDLVQQQLANLKELIKAEMMIYSKKFITSYEINRSVLEIWQQYGIKYIDFAHNLVTSPLERAVTGMPSSSTQAVVEPEPEAIEPLSVVTAEPVSNSEEQETLEMVQNDLKRMQVADDQFDNGFVNGTEDAVQSVDLVSNTEDEKRLENSEFVGTEQLAQNISEENEQLVDFNESIWSSIHFTGNLYTFVIPSESGENGQEVIDEDVGEDMEVCVENDDESDHQA